METRRWTKPTKVGAIQDWLAANPGRHAPQDVAAALGLPVTETASNLLYLARAGKVQRHRSTEKINGPGSSYYEAMP